MKIKLLFTVAFMMGLLGLTSFTTFLNNGYEIGDVAADFTLQGVDDQAITLSEYMGEGGVIVIFTCNTCPYAQLYEDRIIALHNTYAPQGFPVLAINPNDPDLKPGDSFEAMKVRAEKKKFPFPYLFDRKQEIYPQFGATKTPHVYVLDNHLAVKYIGAIDDNPREPDNVEMNYIANAISAILAGSKVDPAITKAIGCGIKAKRS